MLDLTGKVTGDTLTAAEFVQLATEIKGVIEAFGVASSGGDLEQVLKGLTEHALRGDYYVDSGAVNAYVLTPSVRAQVLTAYNDGVKAVFIPTVTNTGASTVNVGGLGVEDVVSQDGAPLSSGEIQAGIPAEILRISGEWRLFSSKTDAQINGTYSSAQFLDIGVVSSDTTTFITAMNFGVARAGDSIAFEGMLVFDGDTGGGADGISNNGLTLRFAGADGATFTRSSISIAWYAQKADSFMKMDTQNIEGALPAEGDITINLPVASSVAGVIVKGAVVIDTAGTVALEFNQGLGVGGGDITMLPGSYVSATKEHSFL